MGFNAQAFGQAQLEPRTAEVSVPELSDWFDDGEEPVFIVRGLTADEMARAKEALINNMRKLGLVDALQAGARGQIAQEMAKALGADEDKHADIAFRQEMIRQGVVEPALDEQTIARLASHFALVIYRLSDRINLLTGQGSEAEKKPKPSTAMTTSEPA